MQVLGQLWIPDGDEPRWSEMRERERMERTLARMRRQTRRVDRRQYRGNVQRRRWR